MYYNVLYSAYIHTHTQSFKFSASPGQRKLPAAVHKLFMFYRTASGLLHLFWEICCALLVNDRIRWTGLGAFASRGETNLWLLLPKRRLLCTLLTGRKDVLSLGYFHRAVGRLHVSLWPHGENASYTLSVPGRLVCLPQRPHGEEISRPEKERT